VTIRFLTSIASSRWAFHAGDTLEVKKLTAEIQGWLKSQEGRPPIAEVVRLATDQVAVTEAHTEMAVLPNAQTRRRSRTPPEDV
jgi:hypothetical protein